MIIPRMCPETKTRVVIYSRPGCHLCHEAEAAIRRSSCYPEVEVETVNIDEDRQLQERYRNDVPVVFINGIKAFKHRVTSEAFCRKVQKLRKYEKRARRSFA